jgi:hypothetical protein
MMQATQRMKPKPKLKSKPTASTKKAGKSANSKPIPKPPTPSLPTNPINVASSPPATSDNAAGGEDIAELQLLYISNWTLFLKEKNLLKKGEPYILTELGSAALEIRTGTIEYDTVVDWMDTTVRAYSAETENPDFLMSVKQDRITATAYYGGLPRGQWLTSVFSAVDSLEHIERCMINWARRMPQKNYRLDIVAHIVKLQVIPILESIPPARYHTYLPPSSTTASTPTPAPASIPSTPSSRRTATDIQRLAIADLGMAEEASGNYTMRLTEKWACSNTGCSNHSFTCWYETSDLAQSHFPVNGVTLRDWSQEIRLRNATVDTPSARIAIRLANERNRERKKVQQPAAGAGNGGGSGGGAGPTVVFQMPQMPGYGSAYGFPPYIQPPAQGPQAQGLSHEPSSPIREDPDDILSDFFVWLIGRPGWSLNDNRLFEGYREGLIEKGYTLDDVKDESAIQLERWIDWGFKEGHLRRLRGEARTYKAWRRAGKI